MQAQVFLLLLAGAPAQETPCVPDSAMTVAAARAFTPEVAAADIDSSMVRWLGSVSSAGEVHLALVGGDAVRPLFVTVGCDGSVRGRRETGEIDSVEILHLLPDAQAAAMVRYRSGYGTGWLQYSAAVLTFAGDSITVSFDAVTDGSSQDEAADRSMEDSASVTLTAPGTLTRRGVHYLLRCSRSGTCRRTEGRPFLETYHWDPASRTFARTTPARRSR